MFLCSRHTGAIRRRLWTRPYVRRTNGHLIIALWYSPVRSSHTCRDDGSDGGKLIHQRNVYLSHEGMHYQKACKQATKIDVNKELASRASRQEMSEQFKQEALCER